MIVVTGVHRSGTSLVAMLMEALGIDFGPQDAFYPADSWNARGYFERRDVVDLNSRLITGFQRTSGRAAPLLSQLRYLTMPAPASIRRRARRMTGELESLGRRVGRFAVKDPRFCMTLDVWARSSELDACVVCLRHPAEVAKSLQLRQRVPSTLAFRFWDYHVESLLDALPERTIAVDHAALHSPEAAREVERIATFFGRDAGKETVVATLATVLSRELRRAGPEARSRALPLKTHRLWERLRRLRTDVTSESSGWRSSAPPPPDS